MSIQSSLDELESIKQEIKRNNAINKGLRDRCKVIESDVESYLVTNKREGVRYKGTRVVLEQSTSTKKKTKKDREEESKRLLRDMGVADADNAYDKLHKVQYRDEVETTKLRVHKDTKPTF